MTRTSNPAAVFQSEEKYRLIAESSSDGILQMNANSQIIYASPAYLRLFGFTEAQALAQTPEDIYALIHPDERDALFARIYQAIADKAPDLRYTFRVKHPLGHYRWREDHTTFNFDAQGNYAGCQAICRDITERQEMLEALQDLGNNAMKMVQSLSASQTELTQARQSLRDLAAQNEREREAQLRHVAREVHDELGQLLTALRMDMSLLEMRFGMLDPALPAQLAGSKALIDRTIGAVRQVAANLRPPELDLGLVSALEFLCAEFASRHALHCVLHASSPATAKDEARDMVVFRIAQESLTNVARYAQASEVNVSLMLNGSELRLKIQDNGQGFDMAAVAARHTLGLLGMRERALALGGGLEVISAPGQGTVVCLNTPLDLKTIGSPS